MHTQVYIERDRGTYGEVERHRETERERERWSGVCVARNGESHREMERWRCVHRETQRPSLSKDFSVSEREDQK